MPTYHHGDLRRTLLDHAAEAVAAKGPEGMSVRELARGVGVSHAAATHHFGDRAGLFTALAAQGYLLLADALDVSWTEHASFLEAGVAYVGFSLEHPGHFAVMFRHDLLRADDPELLVAQARSRAALLRSAAAMNEPGPGEQDLALAGWALVHGVAVLWSEGNLRDGDAGPLDVARRLASVLGPLPIGRRATEKVADDRQPSGRRDPL